MNSNWIEPMDWVVVCSAFVMIIGFIIDIFKSFKDKKDLSRDHRDLSQGQKDLHRDLLKGQEKTSDEHKNLSEKISDIDKMLYGEIQRNKAQDLNLSEEQRDASKYADTFCFLSNEVKRLQLKATEQEQTIEQLTKQITELKNQPYQSREQRTVWKQTL